MYICLRNAVTDSQIRALAASGATRPNQVFAARNCSARCAGCTRTILAILRETGPAAGAPA